tara:strand:+ start:162 stop:455 length:294 start_codon:yes stop_codon:yes gene_type:complete
MASGSTQITVGNIYKASLRDGARGVIQFTKGDTNLSVYGSLDDVTYILIEAFTASAIKEIALPLYVAVVAGSTAQYAKASLPGTSFGTSTFFINETR